MEGALHSGSKDAFLLEGSPLVVQYLPQCGPLRCSRNVRDPREQA